MSELRDRLKQQITADYIRHQPECASYADRIIDHLFSMPQMQSDDDVVKFYESYQQMLEKKHEWVHR